jgi:RNA polymerase sigma factor (TIGR02999 family)
MDGEVMQILKTATAGGGLPSEELLPLVYDELRSLASSRMKNEPSAHTLQATALVHEAWLRVSGKGDRMWNDRAHFFRVAALEMRRILVESARAKSRIKRGPDMQRISIDDVDLPEIQQNERILLIDEMLQQLELEDPASARVVTLKFFGGLTNSEVAKTEGVGERTIERQWAFAKASLFEMIQRER